MHGQRYLPGQRLQAEHWLDARAGDLVWCTAASGWSKSARNVFIAPWLRGAAALLHDARFDPHERLEVLAAEGVNVLCMAPTEYRVIAKRAAARGRCPALRGLVAAGEALNPEVLRAFEQGTGLRDPRRLRTDGDRTADRRARRRPRSGPGSMGRPLPGVTLEVRDGELVLADPPTDPTFFVGLSGRHAGPPSTGPWATGDRVAPGRGRLPVLRGPHRRRDHLGRLPDRAVRGRVGAASPTPRWPRRRWWPRPTRSAGRSSAPWSCCATATRRAPSWPQSSRITSSARPPRTSTRASSSSPPSCPRRPAARSARAALRAQHPLLGSPGSAELGRSGLDSPSAQLQPPLAETLRLA